MKLQRPLVVFDFETTGTDPRVDRIVQFAFLKVPPSGGNVSEFSDLVNPGMPIPPEATAIHRINDLDVSESGRFSFWAPLILTFVGDADLCGFNIKAFDLPLLHAELSRCGLALDMGGRHIIDVLEFYHRENPRTLVAAVKQYLNHDTRNAHNASVDASATWAVFLAMMQVHGLPQDVAELAAQFPTAADPDGFFVRAGTGDLGEIRFAKGKHRGRTLTDVADQDQGYLQWMRSLRLHRDTQNIVEAAVAQANARRAMAAEQVSRKAAAASDGIGGGEATHP